MDMAINSAQGAMQNLPAGTVHILTGRELPLKPCPDPSVMDKARREKFNEAARLGEQNAALREQAWTIEQSIPATLAKEADDAAEAARGGDTIAPSKVPEMREEVERLRAEAAAFKKAQREALAEALDVDSAEFEAAFGKADQGVGDAYAAAVKAGEDFEAAISDMIRATAARSWVYSVLGSGVHPPRARLVAPATAMSHPNGNRIAADEAVALALDALRAQIVTRAEE